MAVAHLIKSIPSAIVQLAKYIVWLLIWIFSCVWVPLFFAGIFIFSKEARRNLFEKMRDWPWEA